jgi:hypothetical protein
MNKFFSKFVGILILVIIAILFGMMSPGQWLTNWSWELKRLYHQFHYRNTPIAQNSPTDPFGLKIVYVKNETTGELETYLKNTQSHEMLPVYDINGTTHVGDIEHRLQGIREEAQKSLEEGGTTVLDKLKQLQELF